MRFEQFFFFFCVMATKSFAALRKILMNFPDQLFPLAKIEIKVKLFMLKCKCSTRNRKRTLYYAQTGKHKAKLHRHSALDA